MSEPLTIGDRVRLPDGTEGWLRFLAPFHHDAISHEWKDANTVHIYPDGKEWTYIAMVTLDDGTDTYEAADDLKPAPIPPKKGIE